jgi:F-type H+-transporting ATPase subunit alpha
MDAIGLDRIKEYQRRLTEFLSTSKAALLARIARQQALNEAVTADLKRAADSFVQMWA